MLNRDVFDTLHNKKFNFLFFVWNLNFMSFVFWKKITYFMHFEIRNEAFRMAHFRWTRVIEMNLRMLFHAVSWSQMNAKQWLTMTKIVMFILNKSMGYLRKWSACVVSFRYKKKLQSMNHHWFCGRYIKLVFKCI